MVLSSSPTRRRAVRGAMILSEEGRADKVRDRNPGVLVVTVPFPANEILGFAPEPPVAKNLLYFILNMTVRKPDGRWSRGAAGERRIGCVRTQKPGVKGVMDTAGKKGRREIQPERNIVDTFRDGKRATELGHKFPRSGIRVG